MRIGALKFPGNGVVNQKMISCRDVEVFISASAIICRRFEMHIYSVGKYGPFIVYV